MWQTSVLTHIWIPTGTLSVQWLFWKKISPGIKKDWLYFSPQVSVSFYAFRNQEQFVGYKRKAPHWRRPVIKTQKINWIKIQSLVQKFGNNARRWATAPAPHVPKLGSSSNPGDRILSSVFNFNLERRRSLKVNANPVYVFKVIINKLKSRQTLTTLFVGTTYLFRM